VQGRPSIGKKQSTGINCSSIRAPSDAQTPRQTISGLGYGKRYYPIGNVVGAQIVRTLKREGITYDFYTRPCSCCGEILYFIARTDGARISCFQISEHKTDDIERVIEELHESFAVDIKALINCLKTTMDEITSKDDVLRFLADELSNYRIRTLDRGGLSRCPRFLYL
jgi:hypothetical protein